MKTETRDRVPQSAPRLPCSHANEPNLPAKIGRAYPKCNYAPPKRDTENPRKLGEHAAPFVDGIPPHPWSVRTETTMHLRLYPDPGSPSNCHKQSIVHGVRVGAVRRSCSQGPGSRDDEPPYKH